MSKSELPESVRDYKKKAQAGWRARKRAAGLTDVTVWVPHECVDRLRSYVAKLVKDKKVNDYVHHIEEMSK